MRAWGLLAASAPLTGITPPCARSGILALIRYCGKMSAIESRPGTENGRTDKEAGPQSFAYAYCHGFLSGPASIKGQALRKTMLDVGVDLSLLNLNGDGNDPGAITCSGALQSVRQFHLDRKAALGDPDLKLRLAGSSLGGYIAARYADLYPKEVDRIFMMCPSFDLATRAQNLLNEPEMIEWERAGARVFPLSTGGEASVPWTFIQDAKLQENYPEYLCPAMIVQGLNDTVVPAALTRSLVEGRSDLAKRTSALFVEDDHALTQPSTMSLISKALVEFFRLGQGAEETVTTATIEREPEEKDWPSSGRNVEVEAKFSTDDVDTLKEAVLARGGQLVGEQVFTDVYWDAPGCGLIEKDWWLRNRAGCWELKVPAGDAGTKATAYKEFMLASEIKGKLTAAGFIRSSVANSCTGSCLDDGMLEAAGFEPFASFRTNREKYRLEGYTIDIDRASFGHEVVEIETMSSPSAADIASAGNGIAALARSLSAELGGESRRPVKGKLVEYISRRCPKQLESLTRQRTPRAKGDGE